MLTAKDYLQLASTAKGPEHNHYLFLATKRYLQDHQYNLAQRTLNQLPNTLSTAATIQKQLLQAKILLLSQSTNNALLLLKSLQNQQTTLSKANQITLHQLLAKTYLQQGDIINSINQRSTLMPLLDNQQARLTNINNIWQSVRGIPPKQLNNLLAQTPSQNLQGWLSLALITDQDANKPNQLTTQLANWRAQYPQHMANALLPATLPKHLANNNMPQHVALLLPLTGDYANAADAIRNGFFSAYYRAKQQGLAIPSISVINTSSQSIEQAYQQAINRGANFIVGPLTKNNVTALAQANSLSVPTLALNSLEAADNAAPIANLYQFGLSPLDEVKQIIKKAKNDNDLRAATITPNNAWGNNIANEFKREWQAAGGTVTAQMTFNNRKSLSKKVAHLLNVNQSKARYTFLRKLLNEKIRFILRRRKDIDVIFLAAQPAYARQIKPLLRFYYAGNIPVFAVSSVYHGTTNVIRNRDMDGIMFPDMPWVLETQQLQPAFLYQLQRHIRTLWPRSFHQYPKLYALGIDAFDVMSKLNKMKALPQFGVPAATGTLYLNPQHHIYRQLLWSRFSDGKAQLSP